MTLSGRVETEAEWGAAARDASQVEGVKTVVNNIEVKAPPAAAAALFAEALPATPAPAPARRAHRNVAPHKTAGGETPASSTKKEEAAAASAGAAIPAAPTTVAIPEGTQIRDNTRS